MLSSSDIMRQRLVDLFPAVFSDKGKPKKPLKVGIHEDIHERHPDLRKEEITAALKNYTGGPTYLKNVKLGEARFDLDGQPAGVVEEKDVNFAVHRLRKMQRRWKKKSVEVQIIRKPGGNEHRSQP